MNVDGPRIDGGAGVPDGAEDPAPVGIAARPGRLDQERIADGAGDAVGVLAGLRSDDINGHELGCAFAVPHDAPGQVEAEGGHGLLESGCVAIHGLQRRVAGGAIGEEQDRVVGAPVAIDGYAIEGLFDGGPEAGLKKGGVDFHSSRAKSTSR